MQLFLTTILVAFGILLGGAQAAGDSCLRTLTESTPAQKIVRARDAYQALLRFQTAHAEHQWPSELNEIPLSRIKNKTKITDTDVNYIGTMNRELFTGEIAGRKVFIKIALRSISFSTEAHLTKLFSDMGIGPHFFGVVTEYGKSVGIVTEFIQGHHLYNSAIKNTRRGKIASRFISDLGIHPKDLQYRVNNRMWIIDPGQFTMPFWLEPKEWSGFREFKQAWDELSSELSAPFPRARPSARVQYRKALDFIHN